MSGICGLFNINNKPVAGNEIRAMVNLLSRRGPDRAGDWTHGQFGLGHTLLGTTPELISERQPFEHRETGCTITADVRLDNRPELLQRFKLNRPESSVGDAELILLAYLQWGENCTEHLLGDFAFAIADPRHHTMFCARDRFGLRPLYYYSKAGAEFAFASDARAILVLPQIPYQIDAGRVADCLVAELQWIDYTSTFYRGIHRLPPGHHATIHAGGIKIVEYWRSTPIEDPGPLSVADFTDGFLEVFTRAVESRLRAPNNGTGSMLSGGMDSGSVVAVAKEILKSRQGGPLPTFSGVHERGVKCAESEAIYAAITIPDIAPILINPNAFNDESQLATSGLEEPFDGDFMILKAIYAAAAQNGQRVVLDGGAGDVVVGEGSYIVRLIRSGKLRLALSEIVGASDFWQENSRLQDIVKFSRSALIPEKIKNYLRPLIPRSDGTRMLAGSLISPELAAEVDLDARSKRMQEIFPIAWEPDYFVERCNAILPNMLAGRERYARLAASEAVEACDPFLDKRVVDFCSRMPGHVRHRDGWPKMILRDLAKDKLPDAVRWARGKPHIGWAFNDAMTRKALSSGDLSLGQLQKDLGKYVDSPKMAAEWAEFTAGGNAEAIHSVYILSKWLRETVHRPIESARMIR